MTKPTIKAIRRREVEAKIGRGRSSIYELLKTDPTFSRQVKIGKNAVGWIEAELNEWLKTQMSNRKLAPSKHQAH